MQSNKCFKFKKLLLAQLSGSFYCRFEKTDTVLVLLHQEPNKFKVKVFTLLRVIV